jgi:hypothetical protein
MILAVALGVVATLLLIGLAWAFLEWRERHHAALRDAGLAPSAEAALALHDTYHGR